jgi:hypothetical protein
MNMKIAAAAALSFGLSFSAFAKTPSQELKNYIGNAQLVCSTNGDPSLFEISAGKSEIFVKAKDSGGGKYEVSGARVNDTYVVISLRNDVDGPHASDVLFIPVDGLEQMAKGASETFTIHGYVEQREDFDGTSTRSDLNCHLN